VIMEHFQAVSGLLAPLEAAPTNLLVAISALDDVWTPQLPQQPERYPYVVVRPDSMPVFSDRLAQYSGNLLGRVYVTAVGEVVNQVLWALDKTRSVLVDAVPVIAGRSVSPLRLDGGQPVMADRDTTPPVFFGVDIYTLFTTG
jgi:hypothetical protein